MGDTYTKLVYHIVFATKGRAAMITPALRDRLYEYMGGIIRGQRGSLLEIGGMPDHVHLLARFRADASVSEMLRLIKSNSSGWAHGLAEIFQGFDWQEGYAAFSVSGSQIESVRHYIATQEEHHAKWDLRDELITLLRKHGIEFDERYVLD
jgi:putative transposase